jgi:hypothetical protein
MHTYCLNCRTLTPTLAPELKRAMNGRPYLKGACGQCNKLKYVFMKINT